MATRVASRELRNDTAGVLRRAAAGEDIDITVRGKVVARLTAVPDERPYFMSTVELFERLNQIDPDPEFAALLKKFDAESEPLGPIE